MEAEALYLEKGGRRKNFRNSGNAGGAEKKRQRIFQKNAERKKTLDGFDDQQGADKQEGKSVADFRGAGDSERKIFGIQKNNRRKTSCETGGLQVELMRPMRKMSPTGLIKFYERAKRGDSAVC